MINAQIYDSATLLGVMQDTPAMQPPKSYWDFCYPNTITFDTEYVDFEQITENRKIAPLVVPTAQGKPIWSAAGRATRVKPAYVKPKDPITATRMIKRHAGLEPMLTTQSLSPAARYNAIVADIQRQHRWAIERRWEWLRAEATINGKVTLEDEAYPRTVVDFGRDLSHTIALTGGNRWGDNGVSIVRAIETYATKMRRAKFGGVMARATIGVDVWNVIRQDAEIRALLGLDLRNNNGGININVGARNTLGVGEEWERVGSISNIELYVYHDYYQGSAGEVIQFMSPKDVVFTSNNINGYQCFGAILDSDANFQPLPIFSKMWKENDPSATFIMNQSAPLMVPVNPNGSLRVTAVA